MIISGVPASSAVVLRDAKTLGIYPGTTVMLTSASFTQAFVDLSGKDASGKSVSEGTYGVSHVVTWDENVPGIAKAKEYCQKNHPEDYGNMDYLGTWATVLSIREILATAVKNAGYDVLAKGGPEAWKAIEEQGIKKLKGYKIEGLQGGTLSYTAGDNRIDKYLRIYKVTDGKITPVSDWQEAELVKYPQYGDK
jgi:branched-chain amino acid transport system substrate-binding protein